MNKFFYFRTVSTAGDDDGITDSLSIPVEKITGIQAIGPEDVTIYFESKLNDLGDSAFGDQAMANSYVTLNITSGARKPVMEAIAEASNAFPHDDGAITIADDLNKKYISKWITGVGDIVVTGQLNPDTDNG
tara:strand:- start:457 stop:852 length:396 start_codon:yes stop_codon:yes gene_type:complete